MKKKSISQRRQLLFAGLIILFSASVAYAQTLSLMAPSIARENDVLMAQYGVTVIEKPILKGELEDGIELVLKSTIELFKVNDYWLDKSIASADFESTIRFDRLKKEFVMTLPGRDTPLRNKALRPLLLNGWGCIKANLGPWSALQKGEKYSLRLITTMNEKDAPKGFSRFFYFWSWDAGSDNTFHLNFTL